MRWRRLAKAAINRRTARSVVTKRGAVVRRRGASSRLFRLRLDDAIPYGVRRFIAAFCTVMSVGNETGHALRNCPTVRNQLPGSPKPAQESPVALVLPILCYRPRSTENGRANHRKTGKLIS